MYFPYLRGKQFELLALRELAVAIGNSGTISPVLEPVKQSTSSLEKAIESLVKQNVNFNLVVNPIIGELADNPTPLIEFINQKIGGYENFQYGIIINQNTNVDQLEYILNKLVQKRSISLIHLNRPDSIDVLAQWVAAYDIKYNFYNESIPVRRYRGIVEPDTKILLEDKFTSKTRNADYSDQPELFSDEHLFYHDDGFKGFGDYLTIGSDYSESGFLPYAVAIHFTYIRPDRQNQIWIRHFVSDSNSDSTDVPGKFGEALKKLVHFIDRENIKTLAADEFREHYNNGHYPGLGSLKKLSIKNHLELLIQLLQ